MGKSLFKYIATGVGQGFCQEKHRLGCPLPAVWSIAAHAWDLGCVQLFTPESGPYAMWSVPLWHVEKATFCFSLAAMWPTAQM